MTHVVEQLNDDLLMLFIYLEDLFHLHTVHQNYVRKDSSHPSESTTSYQPLVYRTIERIVISQLSDNGNYRNTFSYCIFIMYKNTRKVGISES